MPEDRDKTTFGRAIRDYRLKRGWNMQFQLADAAKMPVATVSAIETGRFVPAFGTGIDLITTLVGGEGKREQFLSEVSRDKSKELDRVVRRVVKRLGLAKTDFGILAIKLADAISDTDKQRSYKSFGKLLTTALEDAGLSQSGLSGLLPRGNSKLVNAWCDGRQAPSAELMREVVKVLRDRIPHGRVENLRRARWADMFMADTRFDDMTKAERKAATNFLSDLDT